MGRKDSVIDNAHMMDNTKNMPRPDLRPTGAAEMLVKNIAAVFCSISKIPRFSILAKIYQPADGANHGGAISMQGFTGNLTTCPILAHGFPRPTTRARPNLKITPCLLIGRTAEELITLYWRVGLPQPSTRNRTLDRV